MIRNFGDHVPTISDSAYVDVQATVWGNVELADDVSIWPGAVLRGDIVAIKVGARSNIQDNSVLHGSTEELGGSDSPVIVGSDVTVGHKALLHGCYVGNNVLVGMGSIILDGAHIEDNVMIGAGSLVPPRKRLESGFLYVGSPVQKVRPLKPQEQEFLKKSAAEYVYVKNLL
jgi:carbonic anhydrase/acetyltransferase-like protein (isoleucine patch superfamily)